MTAKAGKDVRMVGGITVGGSAITMENDMEISQTATNKPTTWDSYTLPGMYPKDSAPCYKDTCTPVPIAALDTVER